MHPLTFTNDLFFASLLCWTVFDYTILYCTFKFIIHDQYTITLSLSHVRVASCLFVNPIYIKHICFFLLLFLSKVRPKLELKPWGMELDQRWRSCASIQEVASKKNRTMQLWITDPFQHLHLSTFITSLCVEIWYFFHASLQRLERLDSIHYQKKKREKKSGYCILFDCRIIYVEYNIQQINPGTQP